MTLLRFAHLHFKIRREFQISEKIHASRNLNPFSRGGVKGTSKFVIRLGVSLSVHAEILLRARLLEFILDFFIRTIFMCHCTHGGV